MNVKQSVAENWQFCHLQAACVTHYEHKDLAEYLDGLWTSLRREVCCGRDHQMLFLKLNIRILLLWDFLVFFAAKNTSN